MVKMTEDQAEAVRSSLEIHAERVRTLDRRGLLNTDYEGPDSMDEVEFSSPEVKAAIRFWRDAMSNWRSQYGSLEGYSQFRDYVDTRQYSAADAMSLGKFEALRDNFGYAGEEALYSMRPDEIAGQYTG